MISKTTKSVKLETNKEFEIRLAGINHQLVTHWIPSRSIDGLVSRINTELRKPVKKMYDKICMLKESTPIAGYFVASASLFSSQETEAIKSIRDNIPRDAQLWIDLQTAAGFYEDHIELYRKRLKFNQNHCVGSLGDTLYVITRRYSPFVEFNGSRKLPPPPSDGNKDD